MEQSDTRAGEAARIRERLARLEQRLAELARAHLPAPKIAGRGGQTTNRSPTRDKIELFRTLFGGRADVYPRRWENAGKGKAGYAPVCANEWKPGVCHKPRVRCGACPNQAFVPVTDEAVEGHLRGRHTLGVYPMLADDTCRFLAADFDKDDVAARRGRRSRRLPREGGRGGARALTFGQRRARVVLLRGTRGCVGLFAESDLTPTPEWRHLTGGTNPPVVGDIGSSARMRGTATPTARGVRTIQRALDGYSTITSTSMSTIYAHFSVATNTGRRRKARTCFPRIGRSHS